MKHVAILGLGRMGSAVATELSLAGHSVSVWNRSKESADSLASNFSNMIVATTPEDALMDADVAITFFLNGPVTEATLLGDPAILANSKNSLVIVDMRTSGVQSAQRIGSVAKRAGRKFVDAPVSGSVGTIRNHQLLVMASGDEDDILEVEDVLMVFSKKIIRVGDIGTGQVMKLVVNSIVHALNVAVAEGLTLASEFKLDLNAVYDVLEESVISAPYVKYKRETFLGTTKVVAMNIDTVGKDMDLILKLARSKGLELSMATIASQVYAKAAEAGLGERDMACVADSFKT